MIVGSLLSLPVKDDWQRRSHSSSPGLQICAIESLTHGVPQFTDLFMKSTGLWAASPDASRRASAAGLFPHNPWVAG